MDESIFSQADVQNCRLLKPVRGSETGGVARVDYQVTTAINMTEDHYSPSPSKSEKIKTGEERREGPLIRRPQTALAYRAETRPALKRVHAFEPAMRWENDGEVAHGRKLIAGLLREVMRVSKVKAGERVVREVERVTKSG